MTLPLSPITPGTLNVNPKFTVTDGDTDVVHPSVLEFDGATVTEPADGTALVTVANGGSSAGAAIWRGPFSFAFDTPGLTAGVSIGYTTAVGDLIVGGSFIIDTTWNGTTPKADFGPFDDLTTGYLKQSGANPVILDFLAGIGDNAILASPGLSEFGDFFAITAGLPIKIVVSQNGEAGGGDPGSSQGAARFYLATVTPTAL